jgi:hypothetical protein
MLRKLVFVAGTLMLFGTSSLQADDALLEQLYGSGVHAYNQGDFLTANTALSAAIKGGTNDPRAYYFRGLTYLKLGRDPEAKADFRAGAELEVGDSADVYPVNQSLERVQGRSRQVLEQYRTVVHAAAIQHKEVERQARYEQRAAAEQDVLRRVTPTELPPPSAAQPSSTEANPAATTPAAEDNPFTKPPENGAGSPEKATNDNASEKAAPAEDKNPFQSEPAKPAPKPSPATSNDPFSEPQPGTAPPAKNGTGATPTPTGQNSKQAVQPTPGGVGSLFRAVTKGMQTPEAATAVASGPVSPPVPAILQGIFGNDSTATPPAAAAAPPAAAAPAVTAPAAIAPAGEMPATQPTTPAAETPQPNTPAQPAKDSDNPFN